MKKLLPAYGDGELAAVCSWPDEIKHLSQWKWTSAMHYVNTPECRCNYQYCRGFINYIFPLCFKIFLCICFNFFYILIKFKYIFCEGDCHDSHMQKDWCVTGAIFNYTRQLMSASVNSESLVRCKFHFSKSLIMYQFY